MPLINIGRLVTFAPNIGVLVHEDALKEDPEELFRVLQLAWNHMKDEPLRDACHGGIGPLADYSELSYEDYLKIKESIRIEKASHAAKKHHTRSRRVEFNAKRSQLVLALIDNGTPYICAASGCRETMDLTIDHIVPLSRGGADELSNLRFLCRKYNSSKGDSNFGAV
jgi:5-methylcytosine-specific restriction endonuclease McrA